MSNILEKIKGVFSSNKEKLLAILKVVVAVVVGLVAGVGVTVAVTPDGETTIITNDIISDTIIEIAEEQLEAILIDENGNEVVDADIVTLDAVDGGEITSIECSEGQECGQGWYVDTSSFTSFYNAVIGQCVDVDGAYGSQCYDLAALFWQNYTEDGRTLSTCGTGAAKGTLNCVDYNAGSDFTFITDPTQLQPGDWVVFTNGTYGHIGMAMGYYNNGYITLLGTNQGGSSCSGGGSSANVINISLANFGGAFRPNSYIQTTDTDTDDTAVNTCDTYTVQAGDTIGGIMVKCLGRVSWDNWDEINEYANSWISTIIRNGQTVYEGWNSETGVGLYAGDVIVFKTD